MTTETAVKFRPTSTDFACFVDEQNGDAVPDGVGQPALVAYQLVGLGGVAQRSLALRAGQDLQEPVVDLRAHLVLVPRGSGAGVGRALRRRRSTHDASSSAHDGQDLVAQ